MAKSLSRAKKLISRSKGLTFVAIFMISLNFFITASFLLQFLAVNSVLAYFESRAQVTVFFKDSVAETEIQAIAARFSKNSLVKEVRFTSKQEAAKLFSNRFGQDPNLLKNISSDIFPASLDIKATDIKNITNLKLEADKIEGVDRVVLNQDIIERLKQFTTTVRVMNIAFVLMLLASALFSVLTTMGLIIFTNRQEIEIMQLVGATKAQVGNPFLLHGAFIGLTSAIISSVMLGALYPTIVIPALQVGIFKDIGHELVSLQTVIILLLSQLAFGIFVGALGSLLSTRRYLKK